MKELTRLEAEQRIDAIDFILEGVNNDIRKFKRANDSELVRAALQYRLRLQNERDKLLKITN